MKVKSKGKPVSSCPILGNFVEQEMKETVWCLLKKNIYAARRFLFRRREFDEHKKCKHS